MSWSQQSSEAQEPALLLSVSVTSTLIQSHLRGRKGLLRIPGYSSSLRREPKQELEAEIPKELYLLAYSQTHT